VVEGAVVVEAADTKNCEYPLPVWTFALLYLLSWFIL
jgi:hypothetical protein